MPRYKSLEAIASDELLPIVDLNVYLPKGLSLTYTIENKPSLTVEALLDTGSPRSAIPISAFRQARKDNRESYLISSDSRQVDSANGIIEMPIYEVYLSISTNSPEPLQVYGWTKSYALVGRDLLRTKKIIFDGPNSHWKLY